MAITKCHVYLETAFILFVKVKPVIRLQRLVAKFCEADSGVRVYPGLNTIPTQHTSNSKMSPSCCKKLSYAHFFVPVIVVHESIFWEINKMRLFHRINDTKMCK